MNHGWHKIQLLSWVQEMQAMNEERNFQGVTVIFHRICGDTRADRLPSCHKCVFSCTRDNFRGTYAIKTTKQRYAKWTRKSFLACGARNTEAGMVHSFKSSSQLSTNRASRLWGMEWWIWSRKSHDWLKYFPGLKRRKAQLFRGNQLVPFRWAIDSSSRRAWLRTGSHDENYCRLQQINKANRL